MVTGDKGTGPTVLMRANGDDWNPSSQNASDIVLLDTISHRLWSLWFGEGMPTCLLENSYNSSLHPAWVCPSLISSVIISRSVFTAVQILWVNFQNITKSKLFILIVFIIAILQRDRYFQVYQYYGLNPIQSVLSVGIGAFVITVSLVIRVLWSSLDSKWAEYLWSTTWWICLGIVIIVLLLN